MELHGVRQAPVDDDGSYLPEHLHPAYGVVLLTYIGGEYYGIPRALHRQIPCHKLKMYDLNNNLSPGRVRVFLFPRCPNRAHQVFCLHP